MKKQKQKKKKKKKKEEEEEEEEEDLQRKSLEAEPSWTPSKKYVLPKGNR